jgi:hypothetical protein
MKYDVIITSYNVLVIDCEKAGLMPDLKKKGDSEATIPKAKKGRMDAGLYGVKWKVKYFTL